MQKKIPDDDVPVLNPGQGFVRGRVRVEDGLVLDVSGTAMSELDAGKEEFILTPGLIDVHTHGIGRSAYGESADMLYSAADQLIRHGTTTVFPTIVPDVATEEGLAKVAEIAAELPRVEQVNMPALHLEGPFMAVSGAACSTYAGDVKLLEELLDAADRRVAIMSLAPEVANIIPVIERLAELDIVPFLTHTQAGVEETEKAIAAGARHATHFYDVFHTPPATDGGVRPVGAVEAILADDSCSVDFIADGVHVHPTAVRMALKIKGWQRIVLITDSNIGAGLPAGIYPTPWGYTVEVSRERGARVADKKHPKYGCLAGSALTMDEGVNNLTKWLHLPFARTFAMGTLNPAKLLGLKKGAVEPGYDADLVLWEKLGDNTYRACRTWLAGELSEPARCADSS